MNHSHRVGPHVTVIPCDKSTRLGKALSEDESSLEDLENKWIALLKEGSRSWPGEERPGWIPTAVVYMILEQVYKDGITVGARSWRDDPEDDQLLEHFSYGGTNNE